MKNFQICRKTKTYRFKKSSKPKKENLKKKIHTQTDHSQISENKLLKAKYLKAAREKQHIIYWGMIIQMTVDFTPKLWRPQWHSIFKVLKEKSTQNSVSSKK